MAGPQPQSPLPHAGEHPAIVDTRLGNAHALPAPQRFSYSGHHYGPRPLPPGLSSPYTGAASTESVKSGDSTGSYSASSHPTPQPYFAFATPPSHSAQLPRSSVSSAGGPSNNASPVGSHPPNQHQADSDEDSEEEESHNVEDTRKPRACEPCRGLKVRCDQDPSRPDIPCRRCAKAGRQCVVTQPTRRRQKKADSRVADLEKRLEALTATVMQQQQLLHQHASAPSTSSPSTTGNPSSPAPLPPYKRRRPDEEGTENASHLSGVGRAGALMATNPPAPSTAGGGPPGNEDHLAQKGLAGDATAARTRAFTDRMHTLIPKESGYAVFDRYAEVLSPHLPAVVFSPDTTAQQIAKEKPILYGCILSVAWKSDNGSSDIGSVLLKEAINTISDCAILYGYKSLELVQAIQVLSLWYKPPERSSQTSFYQLMHIALVMALDLGLGRRFNLAKARRGFGGSLANYAPGPHQELPQDSDTLEARRAWLTCYYLCASSSMVFRRPNMIRWDNYMKECLEVLETHEAYPSDKLFCQYIRLQHICEEIGQKFLMDDTTATISINDPKVSYAIGIFETKLKEWRKQVPPECQGVETLTFFEQVTNLYLHEIALHFNHNVDDFRVPFTEESIKSKPITSDTLTDDQMNALESCVKAAHGILDTMLSFDPVLLSSLPMLLFTVRCMYALVILIKMDFAVNTPKSELGKIIKSENIRTEHYLNRMLTLFQHIVGPLGGQRAHPKMLVILKLLRDWFIKQKESNFGAPRSDEGSSTKTANHENDNHKHQQHQRPAHPAPSPPSTLPPPQTPLQVLSQVAIGKQPDLKNVPAGWTNYPPATTGPPLDYRKPSAHEIPSAMNAYHQHTPPQQSQQLHSQAQQQHPGAPPAYGMYDVPMGLDALGNEYLWGTGFEQAMDMTLGGGVDNLQGNGMPELLLGDGMAQYMNGMEVGLQQHAYPPPQHQHPQHQHQQQTPQHHQQQHHPHQHQRQHQHH